MNDSKKDVANVNGETVVKEIDAQNENCELTEVEIEGVAGGSVLAGLQAY